MNRKEEMYEAELKRKEQKWEEKLSRKEDQIKKILEHQEEKFKKEMEKRDRDLLKKLQFSHESFYNNQFDRDSQLLTLIKERDADQEAKTKEHIKGFKFLYMSLLKDFEKKMKERDKVLDDNEAYRRKLWLENLDLINNNLSKFLEVMTELVMSLKVIYFQSIFLIYFYIKRSIYMQESGINFTKLLCNRKFKRKQKLQ